jgi:hypothetical protein
MKKISDTKGKGLKSPANNANKAVASVKIPINRTADKDGPLTPRQQKKLADWKAEQLDEEAA